MRSMVPACKLFSSLPLNFFIFNWRKVASQYCVGLCQTSTWVSHRYTCDPSFLSLPPTSHLFPPFNSRKLILMNLFSGQEWRCRHREQTYRHGYGGGRRGGRNGESNIEVSTLPYGKEIASGNLLHDSGNSNWGSATNYTLSSKGYISVFHGGPRGRCYVLISTPIPCYFCLRIGIHSLF